MTNTAFHLPVLADTEDRRRACPCPLSRTSTARLEDPTTSNAFGARRGDYNPVVGDFYSQLDANRRKRSTSCASVSQCLGCGRYRPARISAA
jgi:hypothetical protein